VFGGHPQAGLPVVFIVVVEQVVGNGGVKCSQSIGDGLDTRQIVHKTQA
jgi:hypothetical protein